MKHNINIKGKYEIINVIHVLKYILFLQYKLGTIQIIYNTTYLICVKQFQVKLN